MASYTIPISAAIPHDHIGYAVSIDTDIEAGTACTFTPKAKGFSLKQNGYVYFTPSGTTTSVRQWFEAGRIYLIDVSDIYGVAENYTDAGLNIIVYGD